MPCRAHTGSLWQQPAPALAPDWGQWDAVWAALHRGQNTSQNRSRRARCAALSGLSAAAAMRLASADVLEQSNGAGGMQS